MKVSRGWTGHEKQAYRKSLGAEGVPIIDVLRFSIWSR